VFQELARTRPSVPAPEYAWLRGRINHPIDGGQHVHVTLCTDIAME